MWGAGGCEGPADGVRGQQGSQLAGDRTSGGGVGGAGSAVSRAATAGGYWKTCSGA